MVDIKEQDSLLRLQMYRLRCNLLGPLMRHLSYILILWCNKHQRIQAPNRRQKLGPFDRAINDVFRLLLQELCPKPTEEYTPAKLLSGIEYLMESHTTPLLALPQSKLMKNTTKFMPSE